MVAESKIFILPSDAPSVRSVTENICFTGRFKVTVCTNALVALFKGEPHHYSPLRDFLAYTVVIIIVII